MAYGLLRMGAASVGALTLLMGIILFYPYDDGGLWQLAARMDCVKLCFLDIRPGITTLGEALEHLGSSEWVTDVQINPKSQLVTWRWTGQQPDVLDTIKSPVLEYNQDVVMRIHLYARIPLGEVILRWANLQRQPSLSAIGRGINLRSLSTIYYLGNGYVAAIKLDCHNFWRSPTYLVLGANARYISNLGRRRFELLRFKRALTAQCV